MRRCFLNVLLFTVLGMIIPQPGAAQANFEYEAYVPRVLFLHSPGASGIPPLSVSFHYDSKGKLLVSPGAVAGAEQVTGSATLGKLVNGKRTFALSARGTTTKGVSLVVKGQMGQAYAACTYRGPTGVVTIQDLPVTLETSPVTTCFSLLSHADARGRITGSGKIVSGFDNDSTATAVLTGTSNKSALKWQLKQGTQRLSFTGKKVSNGFLGTLVASVPPANASYKNFLFPGFQTQLTPDITRFRGSVSQAAPGQFPIPAAGCRVSVSSDLDQNGTIEPRERFEAVADVDGKYSLDCPVAEGGRALLQISMEGYAPQLEVLDPVRRGADLINNITLRPLADLTFSDTVAKTEDGKLELVDLPQSVVSIQGRVFNPASEAQQFPGEFADERGSLLISSVFSAIEARDGAGNEVNDLGSGTLLRMQVPKDTWGTLRDLRAGTGRIECPLYYYEETSGEWKRSAEDGWLETSQGAIIPELQLPHIRQGSYDGNVYVAGPITHLSYWNLDWPVESHACIEGVVLDDMGQPVAGASVDVRGVTYTGSTSGQVTGPDGRFCAEVMRSEPTGEDVDGNGIAGESHQVSVGVTYADQLYLFGPFNAPLSQATCDDGGCQDLGSLRLASANRLRVELVTVSGTARFAGNNTPVPNASVFAFDESLDPDVFIQFFTNPAVRFMETTDANGLFSLTVPSLGGPTIFLTYTTSPGPNTFETGYATYQFAGAAVAPIILEVERYRTLAVLDNTGVQVGGIFEYGPEGSGYVNLSLGNTSYWAVPPEDWDGRLPTVPGTSMSWDLHAFDGQGDAVGSIVFTATTSIGGTWSAIGIPMTGTWGN